MIVCHCLGLTDRDIRENAARTAARSREELGADCPAGGCCGGCAPVVDRILSECDGQQRSEDTRCLGAIPGCSA